MKAYFIQRVMAYFIDILIITLVLLPFSSLIPKTDRYERLLGESRVLTEKIANGEIDTVGAMMKNGELNYDIVKDTYVLELISLVVYLLYFVVYQVYAKGQTLGKRLMKIAVKRVDDKKLQYNDMLIRALILYGLLFNIIRLITVLFVDAKGYAYISLGLEVLSIVIVFTIILMVLIRKDGRGLHDFLAKTEVVLVDNAVSEAVVVNEVPADGPVMTLDESESIQKENEETKEGKKKPKKGTKKK